MEARGAGARAGGRVEAAGRGSGVLPPPGKRRRKEPARAGEPAPLAGTVTRLGALGPHWNLHSDRLAVLDERVILLQLNGPRAPGLYIGATVEVQGRRFSGMDPGGEGLTPIVVDWRCVGELVTVMGSVPAPQGTRRPRGIYSEESLDSELAGLQPREALLKLHVLRGILDSLGSSGMKARTVFRASPGGGETSLLSRVFALVCPYGRVIGSVGDRSDSHRSTPPFSPLDALPRMRSLYGEFKDLERIWKRECGDSSRPGRAATCGARSGETAILYGFKKSEGEWMLGDLEVCALRLRGAVGGSSVFSFVQGGHSVPLVLAPRTKICTSRLWASRTGDTLRQHRKSGRILVFLKAYRAVQSGTPQGQRKAFTLFVNQEDMSCLTGGEVALRAVYSPPGAETRLGAHPVQRSRTGREPSCTARQGSLQDLSGVLQMRPRMGTGMVVSFSGYVLHIFHKPSVGQARIVISGCSDDGMSEQSEVEASTLGVGPRLDRIEVFVSNEHVSLSGVVPGAVCVMKYFKRILSKAGDIYCASMPSSMVLITDIRHVADPTWSPEKFLWPAYAAALKCGKKLPRPCCVQQIQQQAERGAVDKRAHVVSGQLSGLIRVDLAECSCLTQSSVTLTVKLRFDDTTGKIVVKADGRAAWDLLGLHPSQGDPDFCFLRNLAAKHSRLTVEAPKSEEPETQLAIRAAIGVMPMEDAMKLEQLLMGKCIFAAPQVLLLGQKVTIPACRGFAAMVDLKVLEVQPISHQHHLSVLSDHISAFR